MPGIGDLVATLGVDNRQWSKGLKSSRSDLTAFVGGIGSILAPVAGMVAGVWGTTKSVAAYKTQLQAQQKLGAVLKATGGAAGLSSQEIADYASRLQDVTNFGDEATIASAGVLATFKEIKGDVFKDALASAQDMSAVLGTDMKSSVLQVGKALNDPIAGMSALSRAGVSFTEQQKTQIKTLQESGDLVGAQAVILNELKGEFGGAAKAMADPWTQMTNGIGDVSEMFGSLLLPSINVFAGLMKSGIGLITPYTESFKNFGIKAAAGIQFVLDSLWSMKDVVGEGVSFAVNGFLSIRGAIGETGMWILRAMSPPLNFLVTMWDNVFSQVASGKKTLVDVFVDGAALVQNFGAVLEIGVLKSALFFESFANAGAHTFTEVIPGYLVWFADNWSDVLFTAVDYAATIFINLGQNIRDMWSAVLDFIAGNGFEFDWTPLTEGARSAISSLPDIPERVMSDLEQSLKRDIGTMTEGLQASLDESRKSIAQQFEQTEQAIAKQFDVSMPAMLSMEDSATSQSADKPKSETKFASAMQQGSKEAYETIIANMRSKSPEAAATDKLTNTVMQHVAAPLRQIATNTQPQFAPEFR